MLTRLRFVSPLILLIELIQHSPVPWNLHLLTNTSNSKAILSTLSRITDFRTRSLLVNTDLLCTHEYVPRLGVALAAYDVSVLVDLAGLMLGQLTSTYVARTADC